MTEEAVVAQPLSEIERVVDAFVAPSKTFTDILRSTSWIVPFVLMVVVTLGVTVTIDKKVGFEQVYANQLHSSSKQEDRVNSMDPAQKASTMKIGAISTKVASYASFLFILIFTALGALVMWGSFNFGLGAKTTFGQMFAVWIYASLPRLLSGILTIFTLLFGGNPEGFNLKDPVGTNVGYYLPDAAPWLKTALGFLDVIGLWNMALLVIGTAIVAKVKVSSAATVVMGWWLLCLLVLTGIAAATS